MTAELEALERRGWEALSGTEGERFYREVMADDGVMVFPGAVLDKPSALRAIAGAQPWSSFELRDVRVVPAGLDGAVVVYDATATRAKGQPYQALMTSVYARRGGRWQLVLHQQTPAPGG